MNRVGVDIGGMSVKAGLVDACGNIIKKGTVKTDVEGGPRKMIADIAALINSLDAGETDGVGVGCPGVIDSRAGVVECAYNLKWEHVPLAAELSALIGKPVSVTNDANAAALGEHAFGVGKGRYTDTVFITLGTGVGGGVIAGGRIVEGRDGKGAELGHTVLVVDGEPCSCGRRGCMEAYCSATALMRDTKRAMSAHADSLMWKLSPTLDAVDGKTAFEASKAGDCAANEVIDNFVKYLAEGMLNFANIFRPQAIILGGGVCAQGSYLTDKLEAYCLARNYGFKNTPKFEILTAGLGNEAGIIGASVLGGVCIG